METELVSVQLARIEGCLQNISDALASHTAADEANFSSLSTQISSLEAKVDNLRINEARNEGEKAATKRIAGYVSAIVSTLTMAAVEVIKKLIGI